MPCSVSLGTWAAGVPGTANFQLGEEERSVFRVVQPPFMYWNETTSKYAAYFYIS